MRILITLVALITAAGAAAGCGDGAPSTTQAANHPPNDKADGYRGLWYGLGQRFEYGDRYAGGFGTFSASHVPLAIYAEEVDKTFFVYGGTRSAGEKHLLVMASYYDHGNHRVPRPTIIHDKGGVDDAHDNPSIALDDQGFVWVFISGRGDRRPGYKYRSAEPYSVDSFQLITEKEMTYPQPWYVPGRGLLHLFAKVTDGRELYWETSEDGVRWTEDRKLAGIGGHFQVSSQLGFKIGSFFNRHHEDHINRTDVYYAQTEDFGETWTTVDGRPLDVPIALREDPSRVIDYWGQGRLQYTMDLNWDAGGNPVLLYLTSAFYQPGPIGEPREWTVTHWNGSAWDTNVITRSDHNMDVGSIYVEGNLWRVIGPTEAGPQPWGTGGEVAIWESRDEGRSWEKVAQVTANSEYNHSYVRRPVNARDPFYAFWMDGNPEGLSEVRIYFTTSTGDRVFRLPYDMPEESATPVEIGRDTRCGAVVVVGPSWPATRER